MNNSLNHIAVIMDGNRRWAKKNNLSQKEGHKKGAEKLLEIIDWSLEYAIKYLTVFAFSTENWNRDKEEINNLMSLIYEYLDNKIDFFMDKNIKLKVIGTKNRIDEKIINKINEIEKKTSNNKKIQLNVAFNYGGRQEIIDVTKNIAKKIKSHNLNLENINEDTIKENLYYENIPDPDLLIRTGNTFRISNFLLWECAYSELYFINDFWPDFSKNTFDNIINDFKNRERRYGGTIK